MVYGKYVMAVGAGLALAEKEKGNDDGGGEQSEQAAYMLWADPKVAFKEIRALVCRTCL